MERLPDMYPLTSLQIGDIQSYLSDLFIFFAPTSQKFLVLVDNRPWLRNKNRKLTQIWQFMVTKYRMSPFKNTINPDDVPGSTSPKTDSFDTNISRKLYKWYSIIDAARWQGNPLLRLKLRKSLHGFMVFEVAWRDVRGINYLNELQTDTSIALEVKYMRKWDFKSIDEAAKQADMWSSGTLDEIYRLRCSLEQLSNGDGTSGFYSLKKRLIGDFKSKPALEDVYFDAREDLMEDEEADREEKDELNLFEIGEEPNISSTQYNDSLLSFRFDNSRLPFKLRQIITSDLRLLTLLESGLPGWVLFFQSYPVFCHFYRPWMRPLARLLYIMISLVTVMIGFYDLYKNVPLLKATASRVLGPIFDWMEAWDMVSRIRYLGTMLFLQNFEKAIKYSMRFFSVFKSLASLLINPLMGPFINVMEYFLPLWNAIYGTIQLYISTLFVVIESSYSSVIEVLEFAFYPIGLLYDYVGTIAASLYPIVLYIWEFLLVPVRLLLSLTSYLGSLLFEVYQLLKSIGVSFGSVVQLTSLREANPSSGGFSIWKSISKDLLSKVFGAVRSIMNGLIAFALTCNRHRLSIYNHTKAFLRYLADLLGLNTPSTSHFVHISGADQSVTHDNECEQCR